MKATKRVISTNYTAAEIFAIFEEQHRLCSPLDFMADATFVLTPQTTIWEWREVQDLLEWEGLAVFLNQEFRVNISRNEWRSCFEPDEERTIMDVCKLLARYAIKQKIEPKRILGIDCLTAAVFLDLKEQLNTKGVNISNLRPSSKVAPYLKNYFSPLMEVLTLTGVRIFNKIESSNNNRVINFELSAGDIITFRDIVNRICDNKKLTN